MLLSARLSAFVAGWFSHGVALPKSSQLSRQDRVQLAAAPTDVETPREQFRQLFSKDSRPVVLYDGVCNMCNTAVDTALRADPQGERLRFAALQSPIGQSLLIVCGRDKEDISSMVVVKADGTCLVQSDAVCFVGEQLEGSPILRGASAAVSNLIPKTVRDKVYNVVANNRYKVLGRRDQMRLGENGRTDRFVADIA